MQSQKGGHEWMWLLNKLVMNNFLTKFAGEIAGYTKSMGEIHRWVNSCGAMVTTLVAGVSLQFHNCS